MAFLLPDLQFSVVSRTALVNMLWLERRAGPPIRGEDHQRWAGQRSDERAARAQVKAAADDDQQKHKQA